MEGQRLRDRASDFTSAGCEIFGISFDTPADNKAFADAQGFPYRLLSDIDRNVGEQYGATLPPDHKWAAFARRVSYLISPDGTVTKAYEVSDVAAHADEVLADLAEHSG